MNRMVPFFVWVFELDDSTKEFRARRVACAYHFHRERQLTPVSRAYSLLV